MLTWAGIEAQNAEPSREERVKKRGEEKEREGEKQKKGREEL